MPSRSYTIWLNDSTYIIVDFEAFDGEVLAFVVRLVQVDGDVHHDVARYDTAHGRPHCDMLSRSGRLRRKRWMKTADFNEALTQSIKDLKANHEAYIRAQREG